MADCEICGAVVHWSVEFKIIRRRTWICETCYHMWGNDFDLADRWVELALGTKAWHTRGQYGAEIVRFLIHILKTGRSLKDLNHGQIETVLFGEELGYMTGITRKQTYKLKKTVIEQFLSWAEGQPGAPWPRAPRANWPSPPRESRDLVIPSEEIVKELLLAPKMIRERNELNPDRRYHTEPGTLWRDTCIVGLPRFQGLRANELANGLRVFGVYVDSGGHVARTIEDAERVGNEIQILGKGAKQRTLVPTLGTRQLLEVFLKERQTYDPDDPRLFVLSVSRIRGIFSQYAASVNSPEQGIHSMRHYFASEWYTRRVQELMNDGKSADDADLIAIKGLCGILGHDKGHGSYEVTIGYVHTRLRVTQAYMPGESLPAELLGD